VKGSVAVVTGATSGVGRATAVLLGRRGARVALLARGEDGLAAASDEVAAAGGVPLALAADVADAAQVESAAERVERELGPIDVWINNAMATVFAGFLDIEPDEYRRATEVTYLGSVWGTRAALRRMVPRDRGAIVQVGSALAYRGIPLQAPYCGAKHAIKGYLDSVRSELLHAGSSVRIATVELPGLNTPQFDRGRAKLPRRPRPVPPVYQPEVAARAVVWAAEHPRRELQVGVATVAAILGSRVANGLLDRYLARTAVDAQQDDAPLAPRPDNLFEPVPGDPGARGRFDEAHELSLQAVASRHRRLLAAALAGAAVAAGALARR